MQTIIIALVVVIIALAAALAVTIKLTQVKNRLIVAQRFWTTQRDTQLISQAVQISRQAGEIRSKNELINDLGGLVDKKNDLLLHTNAEIRLLERKLAAVNSWRLNVATKEQRLIFDRVIKEYRGK